MTTHRTGDYGVSDSICDERRCNLRKDIEVAVTHERELREESTSIRDKALVAQAREYERRLDHLNNNLRVILDERKIFFTREQHDVFFAEYARFRDDTRTHQTTVATWGAAAVFALGILQFGLHLFLR